MHAKTWIDSFDRRVILPTFLLCRSQAFVKCIVYVIIIIGLRAPPSRSMLKKEHYEIVAPPWVIKNSCTWWVPGSDVTIEGLCSSDKAGCRMGHIFWRRMGPKLYWIEDPFCTQALLTNQQPKPHPTRPSICVLQPMGVPPQGVWPSLPGTHRVEECQLTQGGSIPYISHLIFHAILLW